MEEFLELGCGTGRVLIPTALAGCEITGLDFFALHAQKMSRKNKTSYRGKLEKMS